MKKISKAVMGGSSNKAKTAASFVELDDKALTLASGGGGGHHKHGHKKHDKKAAPGIAKGGCYPKRDRIPTGTGTLPTPTNGSVLPSATPGARSVRLAT